MKIYILSSVALETYRKEARNDKDLPRDVLEKRLSAIINNADVLGKTGNKTVFKFGSFVLLADENRNRIETLTWRNELHKGYKMDKERVKKLKEDYKLLGLNSSGNKLICEV